MDIASAARSLNGIGYSYIGSWALLTACEQQLFDRLPATVQDLADRWPDTDLTTTWLRVLEQLGVVNETEALWTQNEAMQTLLTGENSYADYLGGQILQQMVPRLTLGTSGINLLGKALLDPTSRKGYEGWFADAAEALAYQRSQFAGSVGPSRAVAKRLPELRGAVLDLGGGWGAMARAIAERHQQRVDVVDLATVVESAPPAGDLVQFLEGNALDASTWPAQTDYDGAVLSYLFSSIPGSHHLPLLKELASRGLRWIAIHDFMLDGGIHAAPWSLQHAVFVPGHCSRSIAEFSQLLTEAGFSQIDTHAVVDEMTTMVVAVR
jgi:2-hydroxy-4-(methylsulfanyl)butanoate S-methyltransferase